jgi:hypothetical protein
MFSKVEKAFITFEARFSSRLGRKVILRDLTGSTESSCHVF